MKDFYFNGMVVGYFEQADYPTTDGQYSYIPYRGPGHYEMQTSLAREQILWFTDAEFLCSVSELAISLFQHSSNWFGI